MWISSPQPAQKLQNPPPHLCAPNFLLRPLSACGRAIDTAAFHIGLCVLRTP